MTTTLDPIIHPVPTPIGATTGCPAVTVLDAGMSTTIQDLGRPGYAHVGVPASGAADRASLMLANRLVGNDPAAAAFENTFGGLTLEVSDDRYVAVTGAPVTVRVNGRIVTEPRRIYVRAGQRVALGRPAAGLRTYLAIAGGLAPTRVFGSASTDCLSGLGPKTMRAGDTVPLAPASRAVPDVPLELAALRTPQPVLNVEFRWGPRDILFDDDDRRAFTGTSWVLSSECDRVGVRLTGGTPLSIGSIDLPSEGMPLGAIQVPPSGLPIVFLADHPVTGGYPVIGVVTDNDVDALAQAAPGVTVRFTPLPRGGP